MKPRVLSAPLSEQLPYLNDAHEVGEYDIFIMM